MRVKLQKKNARSSIDLQIKRGQFSGQPRLYLRLVGLWCIGLVASVYTLYKLDPCICMFRCAHRCHRRCRRTFTRQHRRTAPARSRRQGTPCSCGAPATAARITLLSACKRLRAAAVARCVWHTLASVRRPSASPPPADIQWLPAGKPAAPGHRHDDTAVPGSSTAPAFCPR